MPSVLTNGKRPKVSLRSSLKQKLVFKCLRGLLRRATLREREVGQFVEVGLLSEGLRYKSAHRQHASERNGKHRSLTRTHRHILSDLGVAFAQARIMTFGGSQLPSRIALSAQYARM